MREAIGGGWLLGFVVVFVVLFSGYLAVSINYTKAFKIKNKIINLIETNEGFISSNADLNNLSKEELEDLVETKDDVHAEIYLALKDIGYSFNANVNCDAVDDGNNYGGFCLKRIKTDRGNYYKVKTFILFELDMINFSIQIPIKGETKIIYNDRGDI